MKKGIPRSYSGKKKVLNQLKAYCEKPKYIKRLRQTRSMIGIPESGLPILRIEGKKEFSNIPKNIDRSLIRHHAQMLMDEYNQVNRLIDYSWNDYFFYLITHNSTDISGSSDLLISVEDLSFYFEKDNLWETKERALERLEDEVKRKPIVIMLSPYAIKEDLKLFIDDYFNEVIERYLEPHRGKVPKKKMRTKKTNKLEFILENIDLPVPKLTIALNSKFDTTHSESYIYSLRKKATSS